MMRWPEKMMYRDGIGSPTLETTPPTSKRSSLPCAASHSSCSRGADPSRRCAARRSTIEASVTATAPFAGGSERLEHQGWRILQRGAAYCKAVEAVFGLDYNPIVQAGIPSRSGHAHLGHSPLE